MIDDYFTGVLVLIFLLILIEVLKYQHHLDFILISIDEQARENFRWFPLNGN